MWGGDPIYTYITAPTVIMMMVGSYLYKGLSTYILNSMLIYISTLPLKVCLYKKNNHISNR